MSGRLGAALLFAATVGALAHWRFPLDQRDPYLRLVAIRSPRVYQGLTLVRGTLFFTTPFLAASMLLSAGLLFSPRPPGAGPARPPPPIPIPASGRNSVWFWASNIPRLASQPRKSRAGSRCTSEGSTAASRSWEPSGPARPDPRSAPSPGSSSRTALAIRPDDRRA